MTKVLDLPFGSSSDFAQCRYLGANGIFETGPELPNGIADRIWVSGGACNMVVNTTLDADTAGWKRAEIDFGEFPAATGEYWTAFDFRKEWNFTDYIVIGSWSVMINGQSGTTYVPIGFRIRDGRFIVQAPRDLGTIGFNNQELGSAAIQSGRWYRVVAHVNLQSGTTGFREVFLDGVPLFRQWNVATTYSTATGHYFKLGPYDGNHTLEFEEATLRIRNVSMWSGNDGYQIVMGGVPIIGTRLIQN